MRLRGYNEETEELDDGLKNIKGDIADLTKTAKTPGGISIYSDESTQELKSTKQLLGEIAEIYDDLTDKQQADLLEKIGGKRGGQVVGSLLRNWEAVDKAMETMENSAGSADREMSKIKEGWDYKLNKLGETWVGVLQKMVDRKGFGSFFDMLQKMSEGVSFLTDNLGGMSTAVSGLLGALAIKGSSPLFSYNMKSQQWSGLWSPGNISQHFAARKQTKTNISALKEFNKGLYVNDIMANGDAVAKTNASYELYKNTLGKADEATRAIGRDLARNNITFADAQRQVKLLGKESSTLGGVFKKVGSIAVNMFAGMAIGWGIGKLFEIIDNVGHAEEKLKEQSEQLASELSSFNQSVQKNQSEFSDLAKTYHELSSGVDALGHNVGLTDEQFQTYNETVSRMVEMDKSIVKYWNDQGQAIIDVGENLDETNKKYRENLSLEAQNKLNGDGKDQPSEKEIVKNLNYGTDLQNLNEAKSFNNLLKSAEGVEKLQKALKASRDELKELFPDDSDEYRAIWTVRHEFGGLDSVLDDDGEVEQKWDQILKFMDDREKNFQASITTKEKQLQEDLQTKAIAVGEKYWQLTETERAMLPGIFSTIDINKANDLGFNDKDHGVENLGIFVDKTIEAILDHKDEIDDAYNYLLSIDPNTLSAEEAKNTVENYISKLASLLPDIDEDQVRQIFGLGNISEEIETQANIAKDKYKNLANDIKEEFVEEMKGDGLINSDLIDQFEIGDLQVKFGNIDMDDRPIIHWSEETREKFQKEIDDWDLKVKDGDVSTVLGGYGEFGKDGKYQIAFSPIFKDENGEASLMGKDALFDYIDGVISQAEKEINEEAKSGKFNTTEEQTQAIRERIMSLDVMGLIAAIDSYTGKDGAKIPAPQVSRLMHYSGRYGASYGLKETPTSQKELDNYISSLSQDELKYINQDNIANNVSSLDQLKQKVETFRGASDSAKTSLKNLKDIWDSLDSKKSSKKGDELSNAKYELIELAKAGKLSAKELKESELWEEIQGTGKSAKQAAIEINKYVDEVQRMASLQGHAQKLNSATVEKKEKKIVSSDTLKDLEDDFDIENWSDKSKKVWDKYKSVATNSKASMKDMKKAANELGTEFFRVNDYLKDLNNNTDEATRKQYEAEMKMMGITNAREAIRQQAAYNSQQEAQAILDSAAAQDALADGTQNDIDKLGEMLTATGETTDGIKDYISYLVAAGQINLTTSGSIDNLRDLLTSLGIVGTELEKFMNKINGLNGASIGVKFGKDKITVNASTGTIKNSNGVSWAGGVPSYVAKDIIKENTKKPDKEQATLEFDGKTTGKEDKGKKGSPSKSSQKDQKQFIDWIERRITRINNIIGGISAKIENIGKWIPKIAKKDKDFKWIKDLKGLTGDAKQAKIVQLTNAELTKEIKYYQTLYKMQGEAAREYTKKANKVGKKLPKSVKTKIKSGKYTNKDLKYWFNEYGQEGYDKIQKYIEYYDKAQSAKQGKSEAVKAARDLKIQKNQNYVDLYDKRKSRDEAQEAIAIGYKNQNNQVKEQLENLKQSYKYQEKIAKLNGDTAELERLKAEYEQERRELLYHEIENIKNDFERLRGINNRRIQDAENLLSVAQAEGRRVNTGWYTSKNINERNNYAEYVKEREEILKKLDGLKEGTTQWNDAMEDLQAAENGMAESQKNIAENTKAIRDEIHNANAELREANTRRYDEAKFFANLSFEDTINSSGVQSGSYYGFTDTGRAKLGAGQIGLSVAAANIESTKKEMDEVRSIYSAVKNMSEEDAKKYFEAHNANFTSIKDAYDWMIAREQDYRNALQAEHDVWADLRGIMQEYYEGQKTYLGEMIEARKKILQEEKDMYDYEKSINEKTKNISTLQKRLAAIQGDNSEAGKARRQQIQTQLDQAQQDLQDTQYERWKSDQEVMLDNLQNQYNDIVDKHLKDVEGLEKDIKESIDNSASTASSYYEKFGDSVSSELSDLTGALKSGGNIDQKLQSILSNQNTLINKWINEQPDNQKNAEASPDKDKDDPNPSGNESQIADATGKITNKVLSETSGSLVGNITKSQLTKMVKEAGGKKGKDGKDYTALNSLLYKKTGYILPDHDALKKFYKVANGGSAKGFDDKFGKDGVLYKLLKQAGFKSGGIGRLVKASGEDGFAMVRNGEGFVAPEHVDAVQQWMNTAPDMTAMMNMINKNGGIGGTTNIGEMNFELPNVTDARSLIETFQNSKDMQRLLKIGVEDLIGQGKFSNKIFTV